MSTKIIDLAKKLQALADRGMLHEARVAKSKLHALLEKHGLTMAEIMDEKTRKRDFDYEPQLQLIMVQVILMVCGRDIKIYNYKGRRKNKTFVIDCTDAQAVDIIENYQFYGDEYKKELRVFNRAFVQKNNLLPADAGETDIEKLSKEEIEELLKVLKMSNIMEKKSLQRKLNQ